MSANTTSTCTRQLACFFLRLEAELDQISGGTRSVLSTVSQMRAFEPVAIVNRRDALLEEFRKRSIPYVVIDGPYPLGGARKSLLTFLGVLFQLLTYNLKVFGFLLRNRHVVALQCDDLASFMVFAGARLAGRKLVITVRNYKPFLPKMRTIYKVPFLVANKVVATSAALAEIICQQGWSSSKSKTLCIRNGIDTEAVEKARSQIDRNVCRRELGIPEDETAIGLVGFIFPLKRQTEFLRFVAAEIKGDLERHRARIYLLGGLKDEAYAAECTAAIDVGGLGGLITIVGYTNEMDEWYIALDIVVHAGIDLIPRVLIEAQAFGKPVVAFSGCSEVVADGKTGILCHDFKEMQKAIKLLLADQALRESYGSAAQELMRRDFDIRENSRKYDELYWELLR